MLRYAITAGGLLLLPDEIALAALRWQAAALAGAGVDFLLVREKTLAAGALVELCRGLRAVSGGMRVLVSGRPDVAVAAGLAGVHLSSASGELTPAEVRRLLPGALVSVSCHTLDEVRRAREQQADMALFGPVFAKVVDGSEVVAGAGLPSLREACATAREMPVLALGGVDERSAPACLAAGAQGVAGIRMFFG